MLVFLNCCHLICLISHSSVCSSSPDTAVGRPDSLLSVSDLGVYYVLEEE